MLLSLLITAGLTAASAKEEKVDLDTLLEKQTFKKGDDSLPYRLLKPADYKKDGKETYPLVVFLHGAGERGDNNKAQLRHGVAEFAKPATRKKHPCFLVAPQCPRNTFWGGEQQDLILGLIAALQKEYRIDAKRIYVTGLSMGGYATWALLVKKPDLFAAAIPICGGGDPATAKKIAHIPIWAFHGDRDGAVAVERSREMVAALEKAGGKPKYTEYKGVGHDSWTRTYRDPAVLAWLFEQKQK